MATEAEILARVKAGASQPARSIDELRAWIEKNSRAINAAPPEVGAMHDDVELRPGLTADIAVPKGDGPFPVVIYLHGGGWVGGSSRSHRKLGMQFAEHGYLTINLNYRLAPERPFPAGLDDCLFASKWAAENAGRWGGDRTRLAIGGDSAGANLAAATIVALDEERVPLKFRAALLIYGLYDVPAVLERERVRRVMGLELMARAYVPDGYPAGLSSARVSPLRAVRAGLMPPTFVICGADDPLLPESQSMAEALKRAETPYELHVIDDMPHGFVQVWMLSAANDALNRMFAYMRANL
jgi:acetyl esterase